MSTEREATPRPWRLEEDDWRHVITEIDGAETEIATVWEQRIGEGKANAQLIVTAVNSFDTMRDALREIKQLAEDSDYCRCPRIRSLASSALASIDADGDGRKVK